MIPINILTCKYKYMFSYVKHLENMYLLEKAQSLWQIVSSYFAVTNILVSYLFKLSITFIKKKYIVVFLKFISFNYVRLKNAVFAFLKIWLESAH